MRGAFFQRIAAILLPAMLIAGLQLGGAAHAAEPKNTPHLVVSPAISEWVVAPGAKQTKKFILTNATDQPLPVKAMVQGMALRQKVTPQYRAIYDASKWFSIKDPDFIMRPHEVREVTAILQAPKDASPGGHYATIYFQELGPATSGMQQTNIVGRVGVLAFVIAKGQVKKNLAAAGEWQFHRREGKVAMEVSLRNTGNVHILPTVSYSVRNWRGHEVAKVKAGTGILMPYTERTYSAAWQPPLVGRFTVVPEVTYNGSQKVSFKGQTYWQIPWLWLFLVGGLPVLVWFGIIRIRGRWQRVWKEVFKPPKPPKV